MLPTTVTTTTMMLLVLMIGAAMAMVEENATEEWGSRSPSGNCHCEQTQVGGIHGHSSASFCDQGCPQELLLALTNLDPNPNPNPPEPYNPNPNQGQAGQGGAASSLLRHLSAPNLALAHIEHRIGARISVALIDCEGCIEHVLTPQLLSQVTPEPQP